MTKVAVILFNLGGPDCPEAVEPFLFNLFSDPAILNLPWPVRFPIARFIARRRAPVARAIYANLGGKSPLLSNTEAQARALEAKLSGVEGEFRCFPAMRYWVPRAETVVDKVRAWKPDRILLVPLYPQYSRTTSGSSLKEWRKFAQAAGLKTPSSTLHSWPEEPGFIAAQVDLLSQAYAKAQSFGRPRVLFSAHGLPKKLVRKGDPYPSQVEKTAAAIVKSIELPELDWQICYQSRIGPLEWIGPATADEIRRAGRDSVPLVLCPLAFVSEHSETLVELDIEYRHFAEANNVPAYFRAPTVSTHPKFIEGFARTLHSLSRQEIDAA